MPRFDRIRINIRGSSVKVHKEEANGLPVGRSFNVSRPIRRARSMPTTSRTHKNRGFPLMKNPPCKTASRFLMCWNSTTNSRRVAAIADSGAKCYAKRRNLRDFRKKRRFVSIFHPKNLHFVHRTTALRGTGTATLGAVGGK